MSHSIGIHNYKDLSIIEESVADETSDESNSNDTIIATTNDTNDSIDEDIMENDSMISKSNNSNIKNDHESDASPRSTILSTSYLSTILAWISMLLAILAGSAIGPIFKYMAVHGIPARLAASWRCQTMSIFLLPMAIIESYLGRGKNVVHWWEVKPGLRWPVVVHVAIAGLAWGANLVFWISGLVYTSTVKASLFSGLHPMMLVIFLYSSGTRLSRLEVFGTFICISGIFIAGGKGLFHLTHSSSTSDAVTAKNELFGDMLCIFASVAEVVVILNRKATKNHVPLFQYTFATTFMVAVITSIASLIMDDGNVQVICPKHSEMCLLGWIRPEWLLEMLLFGLIVGVICIAGFNYAVMYISPLAFSSTLLVDPLVTGIISWCMHLENVPGLLTWTGGLTVIGGVGFIIVGEKKRLKVEHSIVEDSELVVVASGGMVEMNAIIKVSDSGKGVYSVLSGVDDAQPIEDTA